jgi:hypothetical protein
VSSRPHPNDRERRMYGYYERITSPRVERHISLGGESSAAESGSIAVRHGGELAVTRRATSWTQ